MYLLIIEKTLEFFLVSYRKACEVHFKENPIKISYARGQYMYDEEDNQYLDCVNNVTHGMSILCCFWVCEMFVLVRD